MGTKPTENRSSIEDFIGGIERRIEPDEWMPAVVMGDGTIRHRSEVITEEELARRWEKTGPHGPDEIRAVDFRLHGADETCN